nr:hypothetical protein CFP56_52477 [Quercus suber]
MLLQDDKMSTSPSPPKSPPRSSEDIERFRVHISLVITDSLAVEGYDVPSACRADLIRLQHLATDPIFQELSEYTKTWYSLALCHLLTFKRQYAYKAAHAAAAPIRQVILEKLGIIARDYARGDTADFLPSGEETLRRVLKDEIKELMKEMNVFYRPVREIDAEIAALQTVQGLDP